MTEDTNEVVAKPAHIQLREIARRGGCVIVKAEEYTAVQLKDVAMFGKAANSKLIIRHASELAFTDCQVIASANPGNVYFDFTK